MWGNFTGVEFLRSLSTQVYKGKIKKETQLNKTTIFSRLLFASSIKSEIWIFRAVKANNVPKSVCFAAEVIVLPQKKNRQTIWVALEIKAVKDTAIVITFAIHQTVRRFVITQRQSRAEKVIFLWTIYHHEPKHQLQLNRYEFFSFTSRNPLSGWFSNFFVSQKPASLIQLMKRWLAIHINTIIMMYMKCTELK